MTRRLIIAGTHSGVGKTTVALALMAVLRRRGLTVQPFKVGPDFIDPGHHTAVCGRVSRNLDTWMLSESTVQTTFARATADADIAVIEGVMGLFDGRSPDDPRGSTADVARLLGAPVVLVVDAAAVAGSIAAVVKGFSEFDPAVRVVGVICNRVAGPRHYAYLEPAIRRHTQVVPLGWLPRRSDWQIPERHLGLTTREDLATAVPEWEQLGQTLTETVAVDRLLELAQMHPNPSPPKKAVEKVGSDGPAEPDRVPSGDRDLLFQRSSKRGRGAAGLVRRPVAIARDAAFCFYYPENLELIESAGGVLLPFSPLRDTSLPEHAELLYLGGGYPELHAATLAGNHSMIASLRCFHQQGGGIFAECGGLMYCCRELVDGAGRVFPMLDLLPARTVMQKRLAALGYVTWRAQADTLLGPAGTEVRGHEFHYSELQALGPLKSVAQLHRDGQDAKPDGFVQGSLLAGYAHLHFGSNPAAAALLGSGS